MFGLSTLVGKKKKKKTKEGMKDRRIKEKLNKNLIKINIL